MARAVGLCGIIQKGQVWLACSECERWCLRCPGDKRKNKRIQVHLKERSTPYLGAHLTNDSTAL